MSIVTITLNPAIDQTVFVDDFRLDTVNRGQSMQFDAGGKGVNVASFLADYGLKVTVTGLLGAENAAIFERHFAAKGIIDRFVRVPGATRIGVKIVDPRGRQTTDINMPGEQPTPEAISALLTTIDGLSETHDWFVLAGNLRPGLPPTIYADIVARLRSHGRRVALDASGAGLAAGVTAGPTIVKPNIDELQQLVGEALADDVAVERAARSLLGHGVQTVIISMGARGALFLDANTTLLATPPAVTVASTVGAGDAMVAGTIAGLSQGLSLAASARLATAFSLGAITRVGAHLPARPELDAFQAGVAIQVLDGSPATVDSAVR
jgi:1-phosphofructokinase